MISCFKNSQFINCDNNNNGCAADMNGDGSYNVLDIIALASCVITNDC